MSARSKIVLSIFAALLGLAGGTLMRTRGGYVDGERFHNLVEIRDEILDCLSPD